MYNAVGIDVSKGKSTVAVLQPAGVIIRKPLMLITHPVNWMSLPNILAVWKVKPVLFWNAPGVTMNQW